MEDEKFLKRSFLQAFPVVLGYLPIGFAYGVLAVNSGLTLVQAMAMSIFVYAGSSQLIAVGLISQGINPVSIVITTLIVNLRHFLMSAALSPYLRNWQKTEIAGFCFELTDETFAVHSLHFRDGQNSPRIAIPINIICQLAWLIGSLLGVLVGGGISDIKPFALDYALPAMFIALLLLQIHNWKHIFVALAGGLLSMGLWVVGVTQWNVIVATVIAATLGAFLETSRKISQPDGAEL